jgi:hypothetical protein
MNKKEIISKKKDPESYAFSRLEQLEKELKDEVRAFIETAKRGMKENELFEDFLEPAKKMAERESGRITAEAVQALESRMSGKMEVAFKRIEKAGESIIGKVEKEVESLKEECEDMTAREFEQVFNKIQGSVDVLVRDIEKLRGPKGEDGRPGENGKNGDDGKPGENGKNGSPDTPRQIADKLNTIKESVDISVIKGLEKVILGLQKAIREKREKGGGPGGGGMGNAVPQSFSVGASTTSITLSGAVASNGRAIWLNYQGQQQAYGTHFTVAGKVVTLLFTPVNGTFIDVIYIRR